MSTELKEPRHLRPLLVLTMATVILYASVLGMLIWNFSTIQENKRVLCAVKTDLEHSIPRSEQFLEDNPEGIPGIPAELIRQGIEDDKQTLEAFADLTCPSEP